MANSTPAAVVRETSTLSLLWGVLLIILGIMAIAYPLAAAAAVNVVLAWLITLAGVVHVMLAFRSHGAGRVLWRLLVGLAYLFIGVYLIVHPVVGIATLTLVIACLFVIEGIFEIIWFFRTRSGSGSFWLLFDGIVTLVLGGLIYMHWPSSAVWAIGTLVGVSMISSGISRVMMSLAARTAVA